MNRADIVCEARSWLGTPFRHQGRLKGIGADCAGIVIGVAGALGLKCADIRGYSRMPGEEFQNEVARQLVRIAYRDLLPADLLTFAFDSLPQHIALVTGIDPPRILHSHASVGSCVEQNLDDVWISRVRGAWRFPELA